MDLRVGSGSDVVEVLAKVLPGILLELTTATPRHCFPSS